MGPGCLGRGSQAATQCSLPACSKNTVPLLGAGFPRREMVLLGTHCVCHGVCKARADLTGVARPFSPA